MEVDPLEDKTSDTTLMAYGNSSTEGITGISALSASAPCPISLLPGLFILLGTGTGIPLHSDRFNFDEKVLEKCVEIYKHFIDLKD